MLMKIDFELPSRYVSPVLSKLKELDCTIETLDNQEIKALKRKIRDVKFRGTTDDILITAFALASADYKKVLAKKNYALKKT